jgi:hypothetical protein
MPRPCRMPLRAAAQRQLSEVSPVQHREPTHVLHVRLGKSWWRVTGGSLADFRPWERAAPLSTGPDGRRASNNAVSANSKRRKQAPVWAEPVLRRTGRNDASPRRPAGGAADRSPRAGAARSRSGARPPAGTGPGSRAARRTPAGRQSRWSSGGSRSVYPSSRPVEIGRGCSASSPVNWATAASTTGICPPSAGHWTRSCGPTGGGRAGAAHLTSPERPEPELPYCSCRAPALTVTVTVTVTVVVEREANGG